MRTIFRNFISVLRKYHTSSIINILGISLALVAFYIIMVQVNYDLTYNKKVDGAERIYRIEYNSPFDGTKYMHWLNRPTGESFITATPLIECGGAEQNRYSATFSIGSTDSHHEVKMYLVKASLPILKVFDIKASSGNFDELSNPKTIALLDKKAKELGIKLGDQIFFGDAKPGNERTVVAMFAQNPQNTEFGKMEAFIDIALEDIDLMGRSSYCYYLKIQPNVGTDVIEASLYNAYKKLMESKDWPADKIEDELQSRKIRFLPLKATYFANDVEYPAGEVGNKSTCYTLLGIAILVILIALINFINFFFALVPIRVRTVNTYKIFGCPIAQLRASFIFEALGLIFIALLFAWLLVELIKSTEFAGYISSSMDLSDNPTVLLYTIATAIAIAIIGSIYPSYYITSFPSAMVIKGSFASSKFGQRLRYTLIGLQFVISISLIICASFIKLQHNFLKQHNMGFNRECLMSAYVPGHIADNIGSRNEITSRLLESPQIVDVAWTQNQIVSLNGNGWETTYKDGRIGFQSLQVTYNFLHFMGIDIMEGRDFTASDEMKDKGSIIFNEEAKKQYGLSLGEQILRSEYEIIGFCNNYNFQPLQYNISPFALYINGTDTDNMQYLYIRTAKNANIKEVVETVKTAINEHSPEISKDKISLEFFDQELGYLYEKEQKLSVFVSLFTLLSVCISLMGVFGLVMFETQHRRKEIGLRRVHGARITQILNLINAKFVAIVAICFLIATPISYIIIDRWISVFAYRTPIHWWIFGLSLLVILAITTTTVTIRCYKAASENPSNSIKTE